MTQRHGMMLDADPAGHTMPEKLTRLVPNDGTKGVTGVPDLFPKKAQEIIKERQGRQATPPKFIRDQMAVDDIEGARSKRYIRRSPPKNIFKTNDIDGAQPHYVTRNFIPRGMDDYGDVVRSRATLHKMKMHGTLRDPIGEYKQIEDPERKPQSQFEMYDLNNSTKRYSRRYNEDNPLTQSMPAISQTSYEKPVHPNQNFSRMKEDTTLFNDAPKTT